MVPGGTGVSAKLSEQAALTARLMLYGLLAIVLMAMDHRGKYVPRVREAAGYFIEPIYHAVEWPVSAARGVYAFFQSSSHTQRENARLREQLLGQQGDLQRLAALTEENHRLRALLEGTASQRFEFRFAELIAVDLDPFSHKVVIDRGSSSGVERGQAVIDGAGVMGQVEEVHPHLATVRLISDPNHALPVQINRTGQRTVAYGSGETQALILPSIPREADVREGDLVVTSGLGGRFPGGYPVATVTAVDRDEGLTFARATARPLAALDRGREVLLIRTLAPEPTAAGEEVDPRAHTDAAGEQVDSDGEAVPRGESPEAAGGADGTDADDPGGGRP